MVDISKNQLEEVKKILSNHVPDHEIWIFGSRIQGTKKKYADLDIAIISDFPIPPGIMGKLKETFSESNLAFKVDVVDWAAISESFQKIIEKNHEIL